VYSLTKSPKRIVWAYDELQKLSESNMPSTEELFGKDESGNARVRLVNEEGQPRQDLILPVCYRNTPWSLTLAHALGFGIYRSDGLVQHFDDPALWREIGYQIVSGNLTLGSEVVLNRGSNSYPRYFTEFLTPEDAVISKIFDNDIEQAEWLAAQIKVNLTKDELEADDILIVIPNAFTAKKCAAIIIDALSRQGIPSHLAGVSTSKDEIFIKGSVAIANIFRSKGNEAPMVYILDCQHCFSGYELITLRNILFTAITRSRAWVRLCGWGDEMRGLNKEIKEFIDNGYQLKFKVPTVEELRRLRKIHRDRTASEKEKIQKAEKGLVEFLDFVNEGEIDIKNLPPILKSKLKKLINNKAGDEL
jgi:superfamily I DNA and RNA helicase